MRNFVDEILKLLNLFVRPTRFAMYPRSKSKHDGNARNWVFITSHVSCDVTDHVTLSDMPKISSSVCSSNHCRVRKSKNMTFKTYSYSVCTQRIGWCLDVISRSAVSKQYSKIGDAEPISSGYWQANVDSMLQCLAGTCSWKYIFKSIDVTWQIW